MVSWLASSYDLTELEARCAVWCWLMAVLVLSSSYVLFPLGEAHGMVAGAEWLPTLSVASVFLTLAVSPLYSRFVADTPRAVVVPRLDRHFEAHLLLCFAAFQLAQGPRAEMAVSVGFSLWVGIFALYVTSNFWSLMAEIWTPQQGAKVYGLLGAACMIGQMLGSGIVYCFAQKDTWLLLISAVLLEGSARCAVQAHGVGLQISKEGEKPRESPPSYYHKRKLESPPTNDAESQVESNKPRESGPFMACLHHLSNSGYLLGICGYVFQFNLVTSFLAFEKGIIVQRTYSGRASEMVQFYARLNTFVSICTVLVQTLGAGQLMRNRPTLSLLVSPAISIAGFVAVWRWNTLSCFSAFWVCFKCGHYAIEKPAKELLFTTVPPEVKFSVKGFMDTFVYKAGRAAAGILLSGMVAFSVTELGRMATALVVCVAWGGVGLYVGDSRWKSTVAARP